MNSESNTPDLPLNPSGLPARLPVGRMREHISRLPTRAGAAPASDAGLTPAFLWRVFCQWWTWVVPLGILFAVTAGGIVWYFHTPQYSAMSLVKIESEVPYIAFDKGHLSQDADRYIQTQIELLRSPMVLAKILGRQEIAAVKEIKQSIDPIEYLQEKLSIEQVGKSELYRVSYASSSARDAANVADAIVAEYLKMQIQEQKTRSDIVIDVLEKERKNRAIKVEQLQKEVADLAQDLTGRDAFGQGVVLDIAAFSPAASIYQSLTDTDVDLAMLEADLQALNDAPTLSGDKAAALGLLALEISGRPDVRQVEQRIVAIGENMALIKSKPRVKIGETWETDPEYLRLEKLHTDSKVELEEVKATARKELIEQRLQENKVERDRLIVAKTQEIASLRKKRELLKQKLDANMAELKSGGAQSAQLEFAKRDLEREQKVFELIAARQLALVTEKSAPARVSSINPASVPSNPIELIPYKLLLMACSISLLLPLALVIAREAIVRRITNPEQLTKESLLPVLGEVACFPLKRVTTSRDSLPPAQQRELFIFAESIDSLRTNLMLTENVGVPGQKKIIAICSAASGEGKTSVATSLAMSIAEATKQPTLVLDADLRAPDIARYLEVPHQPGVAEVLSGLAPLGQAIHRVGETQAYVMPAGKHRVNPHHILHGSKVNNLLAALREKFSTIVIDTPPILSASESLVYARCADLVVFCSLADVSRAKQVRVAVERLHSTGANIAGTILSGVPVSRYVDSYGSYTQNG